MTASDGPSRNQGGLPADAEARLNAYLDGELPEEDRRAFEADAASSSDLASALRRYNAVEASVRAEYGNAGRGLLSASALLVGAMDGAEDGDEPGVADRGGTDPGVKAVGPRRLRLSRALGLAAVLAVSAAAIFAVVRPGLSTPRGEVNGGAVYRAFAQTMAPAEVCDTEQKFRAYTRAALGRTLTADFDAGVELLGWSMLGRYVPPDDGSPSRRLLLARGPDGTPVVAIFDPVGTKPITAGASSGVNLHRWSVGGVEVYELSTLDRSVLRGVVRRAGR